MNPVKKVSIMIMHDELCQVFNGLMTALSLLRSGAVVTVFFGSRGVNAVHREKVGQLVCLPDQPEELLLMLNLEGARLLACPLNKEVFEFTDRDLVDGVTLADPATYYTEVMLAADMNLTF